MGGGTVRGEYRYRGGLDPAPARGCECDAAGGFGEVAGVLGGGDPPAGRDVAGGRGRGRGGAATGAVRRAAAEAGEARGTSDGDAAERIAAALSEQPGREVRKERSGP